jgi:hypothetical protein
MLFVVVVYGPGLSCYLYTAKMAIFFSFMVVFLLSMWNEEAMSGVEGRSQKQQEKNKNSFLFLLDPCLNAGTQMSLGASVCEHCNENYVQ